VLVGFLFRSPITPRPDRSLSCLCLQVFEDSKSGALEGRMGQHFGGGVRATRE
jgi:hypothetical protein